LKDTAPVENTDRIMNDTFCIDVYPGMTDVMPDRMIAVIREGLDKQSTKNPKKLCLNWFE
jgi:dTDP-4-amino-4,6-dideoxygalactose transaminase